MTPSAHVSDSVPAPRLFVVMGVAGCGKSSVGTAVAERMDGASFLDADDVHPAANVAKMAAGTPLEDADRWPWLDRFATTMAARGGVVVGACSALKRAYRDAIRDAAGESVAFVHLSGSRALIGKRMAKRTDHFMPTSLLDSQFATLEPPVDEPLSAAVDIDRDFSSVVRATITEVRRFAKARTTETRRV